MICVADHRWVVWVSANSPSRAIGNLAAVFVITYRDTPRNVAQDLVISILKEAVP